ncbi:TraX family protein [Aeoliella mucimassa]|uniref:TraX protein n=1 Tax=Aeoliella mucimassa TaxID=2527972 RepID=A0A518AUE1_9BACT|nr:TraX family protein [Aeoliella mucimassa]QDU58337.1 TraX protein [Aeoliella mucimassa]
MNYALIRWLAVAAMVVDHVTAVYDGSIWLRMVGRAAIPGFFLLLLNGLRHTRSAPDYSLRLFCFAVMAQPFYYLCFGVPRLNILFTLSLVVTLSTFNWRSCLACLLTLAVGEFAVGHSVCEGGAIAVGVLLVAYAHRLPDVPAVAVACMAVYLWPVASLLDWWFIIFSVVPLGFYSYSHLVPQMPRIRSDLFYWFYPVHLAALVVAEWWSR